jgi:CheY-like chemotaxis protein
MTSSTPAGDPRGDGPRPATPSVLVVDDYQGFRAFARRLLEASGLTVMEAANAAEAVAVAGSGRPDLVLLDVQLPDADGFEVARWLSVQQPPPVVVLTSTREESDYGDRAKTGPAAGFLPKDQLSAAVLWAYLRGARP